MPSGTSLWKRLSNALRANGTRLNPSNGDGDSDALLVRVPEPARGNGHESEHGGSTVSSFLPWVRRQKSLDQLRVGYQRVLELMDAMSTHFDKQDQRAEALTGSINQLGQTLEQLATTQRTQSEHVALLANRVDEAAKRSAELSVMLVEMPASLQAQADAVRAVARQMEATRAADSALTGSLQQFGQAVEVLRDAGTAQVETLQRLHEDGHQQKDALRSFMRRQSRLLVIITITVALLGFGSIGALAVAARMIFNP